MLIQGDPKVAEHIIQALIEHECQFFVSRKDNKSLRVAFRKGVWKLMLDNGDGFELSDGLVINACDDSLLRGFIEEKIMQLQGKHDNWFRTVPAMIILATLKIWFGKLDNEIEINVVKAGRDGWFNSFTD